MFKLKIKREFTIEHTIDESPISITFKPLAEEDKGGIISQIQGIKDKNARLMKLYWGSIRESITAWSGFGYENEEGELVELPIREEAGEKGEEGEVIADHVSSVMDFFMTNEELQDKYFTALENTSAKN